MWLGQSGEKGRKSYIPHLCTILFNYKFLVHLLLQVGVDPGKMRLR